MKETGLMFKAPLVRSILDGSKTQTRRILKLRPGFDFEEREDGRLWPWAEHPDRADDLWMPCPYGGPGDRIYVREAWAPNTGSAGGFLYRADHGGAASFNRIDLKTGAWTHSTSRWWPSIHMPKSAARIWLDITGVRVERLQDISEADCRAEGAHGGHGSIPGYIYSATPQEHFQHIWTSTGGDWAANPWVWVIDFKKGTP